MKTNISGILFCADNEEECYWMVAGWHYELQKADVPESEGTFNIRVRFYRSDEKPSRGFATRYFRRKNVHTFTLSILIGPDVLPDVEAVRIASEVTDLINEKLHESWRQETLRVLERFRADPWSYKVEIDYLDDDTLEEESQCPLV